MRNVLTRHSLELPTSELERLFLPIAARAGLPPPMTQALVNGHRVDFYWPDLGLVVEADGLRYAIAGLSHMRFSHFQVRHEPSSVERALRRVARRLSG